MVAEILSLVAIGASSWFYIEKTKDNIKIEIDGFYKTNKEMAIVAYEELTKEGRNCEITKLSNSFSEIKVDDKMYYVTGVGYGMTGGIFQVITLKPLKN